MVIMPFGTIILFSWHLLRHWLMVPLDDVRCWAAFGLKYMDSTVGPYGGAPSAGYGL